MRILFVIGSFLMYYFSAGTHTDSQTSQNSDQYLQSKKEFISSENISNYDNDIYENEIGNGEGYSAPAEDEKNESQNENYDYEPDDNPVTWDEDPNNFPLETPDTYENVDDEEVQSPTHYNFVPEGACAICGDGTYSFSKNRRGTCSRHGGVAQWLK